MIENAQRIVEMALNRGASYADVRIVDQTEQVIAVRNEQLEQLTETSNLGIGIRVIAEGSWGFASTPLGSEEIEKTVERAIASAVASAKTRRTPVRLAPTKPMTGVYSTKYEIDPFTISLDSKLQLLFNACKNAKVSPLIKDVFANLEFRKERRIFVSSEGASIEQNFLESGGGMTAFAVKNGDVQRRSYPNSMFGDISHQGYEFVMELRLEEEADRVGREAVELLDAKKCESGVKDIVIGSAMMALQIHESCGHAMEYDRVVGWETSFTGTSFLPPDAVEKKYQYGSKHVNLVADPTHPTGRGSFWFDDEGTKATKIPLVTEGIVTGFLTSRETGMLTGEPSAGAMRADGWQYAPQIFMTNINLEQGTQSVEELIDGVKDGIYMDMNRSWSIDDKRLNFQFGTEIGYEIKNGKLGKLLKNCSYGGNTPQFWRSCTGVANEESWHMWGMPCGKGEPKQWGFIGHGTAPTRFENVKVGVAKW